MKKMLALTSSLFVACIATQVAAIDDFVEHTGVYVSANYYKPSNNGLSIGDMQTVFPVEIPFDRTLFLQPDFDWGWTAGLTYHFSRTHTRFFVEYDSFTDDDTRSANGLRNVGYEPSVLGLQPSFTTVETANVNEKYRQGRVGLKHFLHFGSRFFVDLNAFFEYARLTRGMTESNFSGQPVLIVGTGFRSTSNRFHGWGPGVGVKLIGIPYAPCPNFSIFAGTNVTLLYGRNNFNVYTFDDEELLYLFDPESSRSLVNQVDVDFGVDYRRLLHINDARMRVGVTLGVRYTNLINVFKNGNTYFNPPFESFAANLGFPNDWGRAGPYLQFRIGGEHA